ASPPTPISTLSLHDALPICIPLPQWPVLEPRPAQYLARLDIRKPAEYRRLAARARHAGMGRSGALTLARRGAGVRRGGADDGGGRDTPVAMQHPGRPQSCNKALDRPPRIGYDRAHSALRASGSARIEEEERQPVCHSRRTAMCAFSFPPRLPVPPVPCFRLTVSSACQ